MACRPHVAHVAHRRISLCRCASTFAVFVVYRFVRLSRLPEGSLHTAAFSSSVHLFLDDGALLGTLEMEPSIEERFKRLEEENAECAKKLHYAQTRTPTCNHP